MLTALSRTAGEKVVAEFAEKGDGPFICPVCGGEVILRKGAVRVHHFAHKSDSTCGLAHESAEHLRAKLLIYQWLLDHGAEEPDVEHVVGSTRADVFFRSGRRGVAIEVQRTNISELEIYDRTVAHHRAGNSVIWIVPGVEFGVERRVPRMWIYLKELCVKKLFTWDEEEGTLRKVRLIRAERYSEYAGSSYYLSNTFSVEDGGPLDLMRDFVHSWWSARYSASAEAALPAATIWAPRKGRYA